MTVEAERLATITPAVTRRTDRTCVMVYLRVRVNEAVGRTK